ncbi:MAG: alanine racemase [Methanomassiliicoccus sp.]|nr:alanine racemase [Methanomassiliicoccus sp.]
MIAHCKLSKENLIGNLEAIRANTNADVMAIVKNNAYGHGIGEISSFLRGKINSFGVNSIAEAKEVVKTGIEPVNITLLEGVYSLEELKEASDLGVSLVFHNDYQIALLKNGYLCHKLGIKWLKINTGMNRFGFSSDESIKHAMQVLTDSGKVDCESMGFMTHLACADTPNDIMNREQIEKFDELTREYPGAKRSICNSAAIYSIPREKHYDVVRPGLALYGVSPLNCISPLASRLKPVMAFESEIVSTHKLKKGDRVGYDGIRCLMDVKIGIVAIGYGGGYPSTVNHETHYPTTTSVTRNVRVRGEFCPIVGRVMMDSMAIDISSFPDVDISEPVTLWDSNLSVADVAKVNGRLPYDLLTAVGNAVCRTYLM